MSTGYTSDIAKGISFNEFILGCARAFGACVTMRDSPNDEEIPDEFKPTDYHIKKLTETQAEKEIFKTITHKEADNKAKVEYDEKLAYNKEQIDKHIKLKIKYKAMLKEARKWNPPTPDHQGLKDFMIQQLTSSIDHDCSTEYYEKPVELLDGNSWLLKELQRINRDIEYHGKENQKELERVDGRNKWVKQLRESLNAS